MGGIDMEFKIPKKFKVGGVDHIVKQVEHCGHYDGCDGHHQYYFDLPAWRDCDKSTEKL